MIRSLEAEPTRFSDVHNLETSVPFEAALQAELQWSLKLVSAKIIPGVTRSCVHITALIYAVAIRLGFNIHQAANREGL